MAKFNITGFAAGAALAQRRRRDEEVLRLRGEAAGRAKAGLAIRQRAEKRAIAKDNLSKAEGMFNVFEGIGKMDPAVAKLTGDTMLKNSGITDPKARSKLLGVLTNPSPESQEALGKLMESVKATAKSQGRDVAPEVLALTGSKAFSNQLSSDPIGAIANFTKTATEAAKKREAITKAQGARQQLELRQNLIKSLSNPSTSGLAPAPGTQGRGSMNKAKALFAVGKDKDAIDAMFEPQPLSPKEKEFQKQEGGKLSDQAQVARDAHASLGGNAEARAMLRGPVISGFIGAEFVLELGKTLSKAGFTEFDEPVRNTQAFFASRATETARIITAFGAGTGLSDADREFATRAAAGDIGMSKESIIRIININERASRAIIKRFNSRVAAIPVREGQPSNLIPMPPPSVEIMDRTELNGLLKTKAQMSNQELFRAGKRHRELLDIEAGRRETLGR